MPFTELHYHVGAHSSKQSHAVKPHSAGGQSILPPLDSIREAVLTATENPHVVGSDRELCKDCMWNLRLVLPTALAGHIWSLVFTRHCTTTAILVQPPQRLSSVLAGAPIDS